MCVLKKRKRKDGFPWRKCRVVSGMRAYIKSRETYSCMLDLSNPRHMVNPRKVSQHLIHMKYMHNRLPTNVNTIWLTHELSTPFRLWEKKGFYSYSAYAYYVHNVYGALYTSVTSALFRDCVKSWGLKRTLTMWTLHLERVIYKWAAPYRKRKMTGHYIRLLNHSHAQMLTLSCCSSGAFCS